jgi:hypothetical protein
MTIRAASLMTAAALAATTTAGVAATGAGAAGIPKTNSCGTVATKNGGTAKYIRAYKVSCPTAKAVAGRANGKPYSASRFSCRATGPTYLCSKAGSKQTIVFTYKRRSRKAASAAAASAPAVRAAAKPRRCGTIRTANGGKAQSIAAVSVSCATAKAVAGRATGKKSYKARGLTCRMLNSLYLCTKAGTKRSVVFVYRKPA